MSNKRITWMGMTSLLLGPVALGAVQVTSIDFKDTSLLSEIRIQGDKPLEYVKREKTKDKQIVIELKDALITHQVAKKIDTSSFSASKVSSIDPFQVQGKKNSVQIVIQLKELGHAEVVRKGNWLQIHVPSATQRASSSSDVIRASKSAETEAPLLPESEQAAVPAPPVNAPPSEALPFPITASNSSSNSTANPSLNDAPLAQMKIDEFIENGKDKKFTGKPITLKVRDAPVTDVLKVIGEASGFNMVIADDVKGNLTLTLEDVPWDQAMDLVFHTLRLGAERNNNVLRIMTLKGLKDEKEEENKIAIASQAIVPFVTRVFPISYANLADLQGILTKALSNRGGSSSSASSDDQSKIAFVQSDPRTNSLVVRDTLENMERIKKLIEILDSQTPQVMIEAKIVEASESFSKNLTGTLGGGQGGQAFAGFSGANPIDPLVGSPGVYATGADVSGAAGATSAGVFGMSLDFCRVSADSMLYSR